MKKLIGLLTIIVGGMSGLMFFRGGYLLNSEGSDLTTLRSVGGSSVAEEYYQAMGKYGIAYSSLSYAMGLGIISLSAGVGGHLLYGEMDESVTQIKTVSNTRLIACPSCGNSCSINAVVCPKCGTDLRGQEADSPKTVNSDA